MADAKNTLVAIERDTALRNAVIDAALDCIIMMDQEGLVVEFNPAAEQVFGYTREEAVGATLADLVIPKNLRDAHHNGLLNYLKTGEHAVLNKRIEVPATNKAGDELLVEDGVDLGEGAGIEQGPAQRADPVHEIGRQRARDDEVGPKGGAHDPKVDREGEGVTWDEPVFADNLRVDRVVNKGGLRPGMALQWGTYDVAYVAYDAAGNTATCGFKIYVLESFCPPLDPPEGGSQSCEDWGPGGRFKVCRIACNDGLR